MSKAYLVVRISGTADVPYWATTTMNLLKLEKKHRAVIIPEIDNTIGMLRKVQHYVAWQELDVETAKELLDKKARKSGYKKITSEDIIALGYKSVDELASALAEGKTSLSKLKPLKPALIILVYPPFLFSYLLERVFFTLFAELMSCN